jgi:hypothetical protein
MLFGHQSDASQPDNTVPVVSDTGSQDTPIQATVVNPLAVDPATGISLPTVTDQPAVPEEPSVLDQPVLDQPTQDSQPSDTFALQEAPVPDPSTPFSPDPTPAITPTVVDSSPAVDPATSISDSSSDGSAADPASATPSNIPGTDDLLDLKQQVLSQLSPLVSHLEQSPEEKFRTTMMLIQTTDNPSLLKDAYETAQAIPEEKPRAQALLDVINEINYFTQQASTTDA